MTNPKGKNSAGEFSLIGALVSGSAYQQGRLDK